MIRSPSINSSLQEIDSAIQQGQAVAAESIAQLESAAQQAQTNAQELQAQAQDMASVLQAEQQSRVDQLSQIQANNIPTDKLAALQSAFEFIDFANTAMGDNKLSRDELTNLTQLGKNAQSGFQQFGGAGGGGGLGAGRADVDLTQFFPANLMKSPLNSPADKCPRHAEASVNLNPRWAHVPTGLAGL